MEQKSLLQTHVNTLISLASGQNTRTAGRRTGKADLNRIAAALLRLQRGLTGERKLAGGHYMDEKALLSAYLLYYWPVSYQQMRYILRQLPGDFLPPSPCTAGREFAILDVGSGPGPASAALCDFLLQGQKDKTAPRTRSQLSRAVSVTFTDHAPQALALAKALFDRDFPSVQVQSRVVNLEQSSGQGKPPRPPLLPEAQAEKRFSAVLFSHSLNELWQGREDRIARRTALIGQVLDLYMEENALLILCEPAQTQSSRELIAVRDALLAARTDLQLLAPCVCANVPCPALLQGDGSTCHAEGNWEAVEPATSLAEAAGLDRQSIKMAYFAFRKRAAEESDSGNSAGIPATAAGHSRETCLQDGTFTARIVSDAMLNKA
ncbi:MAG: hypothetical protein II932_08200, partial [Treponema sp.]|nr:hypothetical protein [Treponema sp.]